MKQANSILALLGVCAALLLRRRSVVAGDSPVGKVRRNIFAEIEDLQYREIPLNANWESLDSVQRKIVYSIMNRVGYRQTAASARKGEKPEESYYKSLQRQYLKLVNPAIGKIQYPHTTSVIRNSRGDVVLTYNDYDPERDIQAAMDWYADNNEPWARTVYAIANGHKWIWRGKKKGGVLLTRGLADELFFSRTNLEGERKLYKALIDNKNGWTVDKFVEEYLGDMDGVKDAALDALKTFSTPKAARQHILDAYYKSLDDGTPDYDYSGQEDLPF